MPHISTGQYYHADNANAIIEILDDVSEKYNVDESRIYLTGLSRGGHGTWGLACRINEKFAAIAPISGAPHGIDKYDGLLELPIWTSHNIDDDVVDYKGTLETVKEIERLSGKKFQWTGSISGVDYKSNDRIFISGKTGGHNAWDEIYNDPKFYKWLLRFHK